MSTATERISWFPVPDESELPEDLQGLFRAARERIGFVPNVFRAYSFRPERLSAWFGHFRLVMEGTPGLTAAEREMIDLVRHDLEQGRGHRRILRPRNFRTR